MKRSKRRTLSLTRRRTLDVQPLESRWMLAANPVMLSLGADGGSFFTELHDTVYFAANNDELWKTDGTLAGTEMVYDLRESDDPGLGTFLISEIKVFDEQLAIATYSINDSLELWVSDGSHEGTRFVHEFDNPQNSSEGLTFTEAGGQLFFAASDPVNGLGIELWKTDLTTGGTTMVADLNQSEPGSYTPTYLTNFNEELFFAAGDPGEDESDGWELWKSDGTEAGTTMVTDVNGPGGFIWKPTVSNGEIYFGAWDDDVNGDFSTQLWKSDGTASGTSLVTDFGINALGFFDGIEVNGKLIGIVVDPVSGPELWTTDGTSAGTGIVKDIFPGETGSFPGSLTKFNNELYFTADDGTHGKELWKTDGTEAGTVLVADIESGESGSSPYGFGYPSQFGHDNDRLYFSAYSATNGYELWSTDGTSLGTQMVADLAPGTSESPPGNVIQNSSYFSGLAFVNDHIFFSTYETDTSESGTYVLKPSNLVTLLPDATANLLTEMNGMGYFVINQNELWKTDGTVTGTQLVHDLSNLSNFQITEIEVVNNQLAMTAAIYTGGNSIELWASDGTSGGTNRIFDFGDSPSNSRGLSLTEVGGQLFFTPIDPVSQTGIELWKSDLTTGGTMMVAEFDQAETAGYSPGYMTSFNGELYFTAGDPGAPGDGESDGWELWKSDGTEAGTTMITDVNGPDEFINRPTFFNGEIYFGAGKSDFSYIYFSRLWKSDGTKTGTSLVKDFGENSSAFFNGPELNGKLIGFVSNATSGAELWATDGTPSGTGMIKDIFPGELGSQPYYVTKFNNDIYFSADDGIHGRELWKSDGTESGTVLVADINPSDEESSADGFRPLNQFIEWNNRLYFNAYTRPNGEELWSTDGTSQGTQIVADVIPGPDAPYLRETALVRGRLVFAGYSGTYVLNPSNVDSIFAVSSNDTVIRAQRADSPGSLVTTSVLSLPPNLEGRDVLTADTNGDGKSDLLVRAADGWWYVSESAPNGGWTPFVKHVYWSTSYAWDEVRTGDFNGDGLEDLAGFEATGGRWLVSSSQATGLASSSIQTIWSPTITWSDIQVGDFNNDGRDDLFARAGGNKIVVAKSTGTNLPTTTWVTLAATEEWKDVLVGDFDGDGNDDFTARANAGGSIITGLSTGTAFSVSAWAHWSAAVDWSNTRVGDFNNDGRDDLITLGAGNRWMVVGSSGTAFDSQVTASWAASLSFHEVLVLDLDGDGNDDLATRTANNQWYVWTAPLQSINLRNWGTWSANVGWRSIQTGTSI
ncbi:ELWxxDGT repeat protein [Roseimaritima multifibrata]|nr:ELWxxDGT repeat protein [Roseimaritima multifibrata]